MTKSRVGWQPFGTLVSTVSVRGHQLQASAYSKTGRYPIVDQSPEECAGRTDEAIAISDPLPLIAFGDHTKTVKLVQEPFVVGADGVKLLRCAVAGMSTSYVALLAEQAAGRMPTLGYARHFGSLSRELVPVLEDESARDVAVLTDLSFRRVLALVQALLAAKRRLKRALMQRLRARARRSNSVNLGELVSLRSGSTPSRGEADHWRGDVPWVTAKDLKTSRLHDTEDHLSESAATEFGSIAPEGSVLILVRGMGLLKDVPIGLAMRRMAFNQDVKAIPPVPALDPSYLLAALLAEKSTLLSRVSRSGHGTGKLETDALLATPIWVAPLEIQKQVARVTGLIDVGIDRLESLLAALRLHKRGVMQKLLSGELDLPAGLEAADPGVRTP